MPILGADGAAGAGVIAPPRRGVPAVIGLGRGTEGAAGAAFFICWLLSIDEAPGMLTLPPAKIILPLLYLGLEANCGLAERRAPRVVP